MNILLKHIVRNMKENIGRTVFIIISLFAVSALIAVISLFIVSLKMANDIDDKMMSFDYVVASTTNESIINDTVDKLKEDFDILGKLKTDYGYILDKNNQYIPYKLEGFDIEKLKQFKILNIDKEINLKKNEIIISEETSKKFNLKEGDNLKYITRNNKEIDFKINYIAKSAMNVFGDEKGIIVSEENYKSIIDIEENKYICLFLKNKHIYNNEKEYIENLEANYGLNFEKNEVDMNKQQKEILYPGIIILIMVFAVIFVSLNSIVKIIINERIPIVGTFRSIGVSKKQIIFILLLEMLLYTVIPSAIGALFGIVGIKGMSSMIELMLNAFGVQEKFDIRKYALGITLVTIISTIIFQVLLSIFELKKISKLSIKDTLFNKNSSKYKYSFLKFVFGIILMGIGIITLVKYSQLNYWYCLIGLLSVIASIAFVVPNLNLGIVRLLEKSKNPIFNMALSSIKNNALQINTNIIFIITISISLIIYSFFDYMMITNNNKKELLQTDMYVEQIDCGFGLYDKTDDFYKIDNIKDVSSLYGININNDNYDEVKIANHTIKDINLIYSNDYDKLSRDSNTVNKDNFKDIKNMSKNEAIVSSYYKDMYNIKIGDVITIEIKEKEKYFDIDTPINIKIKGFTDLSKLANNSIIISSKLGKELNYYVFNGYDDIKYFITLKDNSKEAGRKTRKDIINQLGIYSNGSDGKVYTKDGYIKSIKDEFEKSINIMISIVAIIIGLSLIGILNNQLVSFMERRKELASLYSIAMSKKQLKNMLLIENLLAFSISSFASIAIYLILSKIIEFTLQIIFIPIKLKFTITGILMFLLIISVILFIIQINIRKHIKNMNVVEEIKYE